MAARAAENGAPTSVTTNSRTTSEVSDSPGRVMTRTSAHRAMSQVIMTRRRGYRSASQASVTPPKNVGTMLTTNVIEASSAERVLSYTSTVSATRAS